MANAEQHKEIIRKAILKACPELLEIKIGCLAKDKENRIWIFIGQSWTDPETYNNFAAPYIIEEEEILGIPPDLSHLLMAINPTEGKFMINNLGGFRIFENNQWQDIALPRYNLSKPPLEQEPEVLEFLSDLLK